MSFYIHGDNIKTKLSNTKLSSINQNLLMEINTKYLEWKEKNIKITGVSKQDIEKKVQFLNEYKDFIENPKFKKEKNNISGFTSQSKLHSTVIEEFMYYLFKDIKKLKNKKEKAID